MQKLKKTTMTVSQAELDLINLLRSDTDKDIHKQMEATLEYAIFHFPDDLSFDIDMKYQFSEVYSLYKFIRKVQTGI